MKSVFAESFPREDDLKLVMMERIDCFTQLFNLIFTINYFG